MESEVALSFVGTPKGGVLNVLLDHITISSLPSLIPDSIEVLVGSLTDGDHVEAGQVRMPEGCTLVTESEHQVAIVSGAGGGESPEDEAEGAADSVEIIGSEASEA